MPSPVKSATATIFHCWLVTPVRFCAWHCSPNTTRHWRRSAVLRQTMSDLWSALMSPTPATIHARSVMPRDALRRGGVGRPPDHVGARADVAPQEIRFAVAVEIAAEIGVGITGWRDIVVDDGSHAGAVRHRCANDIGHGHVEGLVRLQDRVAIDRDVERLAGHPCRDGLPGQAPGDIVAARGGRGVGGGDVERHRRAGGLRQTDREAGQLGASVAFNDAGVGYRYCRARVDRDRPGHAGATGGAMCLAEITDGACRRKGHGRRPARATEVAVSTGAVAAVRATEGGHRTGVGDHVVDAAAVLERDRIAGIDGEIARREGEVGLRGDYVVRGGHRRRKQRQSKHCGGPLGSHGLPASLREMRPWLFL